MVRKSKEDAQATRELILDHAELLFETRGVSRTSLQDIAAAAGVTRGAIYWHFTDKADVFQAMMDRVSLPCEAAAEAVLSRTDADLRTLLLDLALMPLRLLETDEHTRRVFTIAMHRTEASDELASAWLRRQAMVDEFIADMTLQFKRAAAASQLRPRTKPQDAAIGLFALIDGLMHNWTLQPERFKLQVVGRSALQAYLAGCFVEPTGSAEA
jgi:TetR/AcrR family acrAB operon transcriptional repressor